MTSFFVRELIIILNNLKHSIRVDIFCYRYWVVLYNSKILTTQILQLMGDQHCRMMEEEEELFHYCFVFLVVFYYTFHLFLHRLLQHMLVDGSYQHPNYPPYSQKFALGVGDDWRKSVKSKDFYKRIFDYHTAVNAKRRM